MSEESKKEVIIENESNEIVDSTNLGSRVDDTFSKMGEIVEGAVNSEEKIQTTPELTELGNPIGTLNLEDETTKTELENIVKSMEKSIIEMWSSPEKMLEYSKNAREHARKTHDKEKNFAKLQEIYAKIAERQG